MSSCKTLLEDSLKGFWEVRSRNLLKYFPEATQESFCEESMKFICQLITTYKKVLTDMNLDDFWHFVLENNHSDKCPIYNLALKIMMVESPSNVMAESLGRISNLIRGSLKERMGNCTLDAKLIIYKNSTELQFWELHLRSIATLMIDYLGMSFPWPTSALPETSAKRKSKNSHEKVYNWHKNDYRKRSAKNTKMTRRRENAERRTQLFETFMEHVPNMERE